MWHTYIIKSKNKKWHYVGSTNRLSERIKEHNSGSVRSTKHYLPFDIVFTKDFNFEKEKIIKSIEN